MGKRVERGRKTSSVRKGLLRDSPVIQEFKEQTPPYFYDLSQPDKKSMQAQKRCHCSFTLLSP